MNILFTSDYGAGIGDFLVKIYGLCNLKKYIEKNISFEKTIFVIEEGAPGILNRMLNMNFFNTFFDKFVIQHRYNHIPDFGKNTVSYSGTTFFKKFSAIGNLEKNSAGSWDFYTDTSGPIDLPFSEFDYRDITTRRSQPIPDHNLDIFNPHLIEQSIDFVNRYFPEGFETIYYRTLGPLDNNHLYSSIEKIKKHISQDKKYFITSNSERAKQEILSAIHNSIAYKINPNKQDGFGQAIDDIYNIENLIIEMFVMSYGSNIIYSGNHYYISLFNYYPHMVKKIPLIEC